MTSEMELVVGCDGGVRCIYDEALDLREIGKLQITRASHVEPDAEGYWWADMGPVDGPVLGPFRSRTEALGAERGWLAANPARGQRLLDAACSAFDAAVDAEVSSRIPMPVHQIEQRWPPAVATILPVVAARTSDRRLEECSPSLVHRVEMHAGLDNETE